MTDNNSSKPTDKYRWLKFGLVWGMIMVLMMGVFEPMYHGEPITTDTLTHDVLLWIPGGIVLGLIMYFISSLKKKVD